MCVAGDVWGSGSGVGVRGYGLMWGTTTQTVGLAENIDQKSGRSAGY